GQAWALRVVGVVINVQADDDGVGLRGGVRLGDSVAQGARAGAVGQGGQPEGGRGEPVLEGLQAKPGRGPAGRGGGWVAAGEQAANPGTGSHEKAPPKAGWSALSRARSAAA